METEAVRGNTTATLHGADVNPVIESFLADSLIVARLPAATGAFVGVGAIKIQDRTVTVSFGEEGVVHVSV